MHTKLYLVFEDLCYVDSVTWHCRSFEREVTIVCFPVGVREVEVREQEPGDFLLGGDGQSAAHQERWHSGRAGGGQRPWRSVYSQQSVDFVLFCFVKQMTGALPASFTTELS